MTSGLLGCTVQVRSVTQTAWVTMASWARWLVRRSMAASSSGLGESPHIDESLEVLGVVDEGSEFFVAFSQTGDVLSGEFDAGGLGHGP